ncbi:hypothetical protein [Solilutibacter silvestris]|uniref:Uncharacterized protein n=1 Tax=Solilutibacter silvestris TaxID=1645665 RepID=A0A2K1Q270_9GAMM|nr:hypothetical protein [Lysobacter silvestris]PNS09129.1 hypothetical protein Lysil_0758 [Lysobacter silvestris]
MNTRTCDWLTVVAIAGLAYVTATALHEHLGHAAACTALGSNVLKFGAFYVECNDGKLSAMSVRMVALAGPVVSLLLGLVGARLLRRAWAPLPRLFIWMLASIGLMTAFGYMMFSAVAGIGDLGIGKDGVLHDVAMPWLWRVLMGGVGYWLYDRSVVWSMRTLAGIIGGREDRPRRVQRLSLLTYLAGAVTCIVIGLFNPEGIIIVLTSAAAASLGGTSGFAWGPPRTRVGAGDSDPVVFPRSWAWIIVGVAVVLFYGIVLGPTISRS